MPLCSIVVPVFNHASLTRQCLDAIFTHARNGDMPEVVVVDDGSTDLTRDMLATYGEQIRVVTHNTNQGFAVSCNDGAAIASGDHLVFLNNDATPTGGWLDALLQYADAHPTAAVIGSKLLYPNETIQHAGIIICHDGLPRHIYGGFPRDHPAVNRSRRFQAVTAACALVRRAPFVQAAGFDTMFVNGYEDVDFCLRIGKVGHEIHYCHESVLYHDESISDGRHLNEERNREQYRLRWATSVTPDDVRHYMDDGLLTIVYEGLYPVRFWLSPDLAMIDVEERQPRTEQLLNIRSGQILALLRENIRLTVAQREEEFSIHSPSLHGADDPCTE